MHTAVTVFKQSHVSVLGGVFTMLLLVQADMSGAAGSFVRNGRTAAGDLDPLRLRSGSANGAAYVLGRSCHGGWHALHEHADGHPDPETGEYTSLSTQYRISAIPAFIFERADTRDTARFVVAEGREND